MANFLDPNNELTCEAVEYMRRAAYTKEQLEIYDKWKIAAMTERSALKDARKEGIIEGIIEGKIETAINLLKANVPVEVISNATSLPIHQIEKLKTDLS
jgi:predicted transposase/invertase (TIGR01784 family)